MYVAREVYVWLMNDASKEFWESIKATSIEIFFFVPQFDLMPCQRFTSAFNPWMYNSVNAIL